MYFHDRSEENHLKQKKHEQCDTSHLCEEIWRGDDLIVHFVQFIQFFCEFVPIFHYFVTTHCSIKKQHLLQTKIVHIYCKLYQHFKFDYQLAYSVVELTPPCLIIQECAFFDNGEWNIILAAIIKRHNMILIVIWICYTHLIWLE